MCIFGFVLNLFNAPCSSGYSSSRNENDHLLKLYDLLSSAEHIRRYFKNSLWRTSVWSDCCAARNLRCNTKGIGEKVCGIMVTTNMTVLAKVSAGWTGKNITGKIWTKTVTLSHDKNSQYDSVWLNVLNSIWKCWLDKSFRERQDLNLGYILFCHLKLS